MSKMTIPVNIAAIFPVTHKTVSNNDHFVIVFILQLIQANVISP